MSGETRMMSGRVTTRLATQADAQTILGFDAVARNERARVNFIYRTVASRHCHVVTCDGQVVGYGTLENNFFDQGFVSMLYVHADFRRRGAATALLAHLERVCQTPKLFTSCSQSNTAMQNLMAKLGYRPSGSVDNLGDEPQLVFCKVLREG